MSMKFPRAETIVRYLPPIASDEAIVRRYARLRTAERRYASMCQGVRPSVLDMNVLACAYALGADGAVVEVG